MITRVVYIAIFTALVFVSRGAATPGLPNMDELIHAAPAIGFYIAKVRPWWTCEYEWPEVRREGATIVYGVTFAGDRKCSRSKITEYFELFYDSRRHKVLKMVPAKRRI
jgi:hypothetical protein